MVLSRKAKKKNLLVPLATCGGCASTGTLGARAAVRRCNHACKWHGTVKRAFGNTQARRVARPAAVCFALLLTPRRLTGRACSVLLVVSRYRTAGFILSGRLIC
jgi:hypothetical protein